MIRATRSVPREIFWAQSAHSSKSRTVGDEGTLSPIVAITSAVAATIVAGSLSAARLAVDMPKYFLDQAAVATSYGIFPANLWRASHSKRFCSSLLLHVVIRNFHAQCRRSQRLGVASQIGALWANARELGQQPETQCRRKAVPLTGKGSRG